MAGNVVGISRTKLPHKRVEDGVNIIVKIEGETQVGPNITIVVNPEKFYETLYFRKEIVGAINSELEGLIQKGLRNGKDKQKELLNLQERRGAKTGGGEDKDPAPDPGAPFRGL